MLLVDESRTYYSGYLAVRMLFSHCNKLDCIAKFLACKNVGKVKSIDTDHRGGFKADIFSKGKRTHDHQLVGRVEARYIKGRIGLCQTVPLCFGKSLCIGFAVLCHLGKDIVAGAVHNSVEGFVFVCQKTVVQSADNRNAATAACLKAYNNTVLAGSCKKFLAIVGKKSLVGCNYILLGIQSLDDKVLCQCGAADQLNYNTNLGILKNFVKVLFIKFLGQPKCLCVVKFDIHNIFKKKWNVCPFPQEFVIFNQNLSCAAAYCTAAQNSNSVSVIQLHLKIPL